MSDNTVDPNSKTLSIGVYSGVDVAKIVGVPNEHSWSQVHVFVPRDSQKRKKRGMLLAVFSLETSQDSLTPDLGKELISRLQEEYYGQLSGWPMERLTASLNKLNEEVKESRLPVRLEITAGVLWQGVWYFACLGRGKVLVKRGPTISAVLVGAPLKEATEGVVSVSGKAEEGDLIILGGRVFFEIVGQRTIREAAESHLPQEIAEKLLPVLAEKEDQGAAAALIVKLNKGPREKKTVETETEERRSIKGGFLPVNFSLKKPWMKTIGVFLLFLTLAAGVSGIILTKRAENNRQQFKQVFSQAQKKYQEAKAIMPLDHAQAGNILEQSRQLIEQAKTLGGASDKKVQDLEKKIQVLSSRLKEEKAKKTVSLPTFFDFSSVSKGAEIGDLSALGKTIYALDNQKGELLKLSWENKKGKVVLGDERLKKAEKILPQVGKVTVFSSDGIYKVERGKLNKLIERDKHWGKIVSLAGWLGNLYLLDVSNGQVWQYPAIKKGLGSRRAWIKEEKDYSFSNQALLLIDGSIWVVDKGKLYEFYKGYQKKVFEVASLGERVWGYTTADWKVIYLLDADNHRLLAISKKDGQVNNEIPLPEMSQVTGLVVSPDETVALVSASSKLLKIDLVKKED